MHQPAELRLPVLSGADDYGRTRSAIPSEYTWRESPQGAAGSRSGIFPLTYGGPGAAHGLPEQLDAEGATEERAR